MRARAQRLLENRAGDGALLAHHQPMLGEVGEGDVRSFRPGVIARHGDDQRIAAQGARRQPRIGCHLGQHGDVDAVVDEIGKHGLGIADGQRHGDAGIAAAELGQRCHHVLGRIRAQA